MNAASMRANARPDPFEPTLVARASGIAIVISAFCVAAAIVILFLTSGSIAASQRASFAGVSESANATTLAQRVLQDLLTISNSHRSNVPAADVHADLNATATSLDRSIARLSETTNGPVYEKLTTLREAWFPIRERLASLGDPSESRTALDTVVASALAFSTQLSEAVDATRAELAADEAARAEEAAAWRRLASTMALVALSILALAIAARFSDAAREWQRFAEMLERMVADLAKGSLRLDRDRRDRETVMDAAAEGMFALSRSLRVKGPHASEINAMFGVPDVTGRTLNELLKPLVSERRLHEIDDFLSALYRSDVSDDSIARENPMLELELATGGHDGHGARYLDFAFRRIREDEQIAHVFVKIDDVSERVQLARELKRSERRRERQQALIKVTSNVSSDRLGVFMAEAEFEARRMSDALRPEDMALATRGYIDILRERLGSLLLATSRLKKLAHGVGFFYLFDLASAFEKRITEVRRMSYVDGDAFLAIVVMQAELRAELDELSEFRRRFHVAS